MRRFFSAGLKKSGFTLIEVLLYVGILAIVSGFLASILTVTVKIQNQQLALYEVSSQLNFVMNYIRRVTRDSSNIEIEAGKALSYAKIRTQDSAKDPTTVVVSGNQIEIKEGSAASTTLTNTYVNVDNLTFTKYTNYPGHDSLGVNLDLSFNTTNPNFSFSKVLNSAIARVSAATFDSALTPGSSGVYDFGLSGAQWRNGFFSGNVGIGVAAPTSKLEVNGNIGIRGTAAVGNNLLADLSTVGSGGGSGYGGSLLFKTTSPSNVSNEWLRITDSGFVGIGVASPVATLDINGSVNIKSTYDLTWGGAYGAGIPTIVGVSGGSAYIGFYPAGSTSGEKVRIDNAGNVGIGTSNPGQKLSVVGTIESTSGGIKFPDGTTQTTAAISGGSADYDSGWTLVNAIGQSERVFNTGINVEYLKRIVILQCGALSGGLCSTRIRESTSHYSDPGTANINPVTVTQRGGIIYVGLTFGWWAWGFWDGATASYVQTGDADGNTQTAYYRVFAWK